MKIAIIDVETTGLDAQHHEMIEIGCVVFDSRTFAIEGYLEAKIIPERIEDAHAAAMKVNGYNEEEWSDAASLQHVMEQLANLLATVPDVMFCAHNMIFDWAFIEEAQRKTDIILPFGRHKIDLLTLAWSRVPHEKVRSWSLKTICTYLGIPPEPKMHRAMQGVLAEYAVYTKLMQPMHSLSVTELAKYIP